MLTVALILLLTTGCSVDAIARNSDAIAGDSAASSVDSRLVYASADGICEVDLAGGASNGESGKEARMIYEGKSFSRPVFSQDGTRLLFKQTLEQTPEEKETGTYRNVLYAHDFQSGQTVKVLDDPVSYCAGSGGSFMASVKDRIMKVDFSLQEREGTLSLVPETEEFTPEAETVPDKDSITAVLYDNLKPSPDFKYLAFNIDIRDDYIIAENWEGGHYSGGYSGGLYLLNMETGETSLVVAPVRHFEAEDGMGNDPEPGPWSRDGKILCVWDKVQSGSMTADGVSIFFYHTDTGKKTEYSGGTLAYDENISYSAEGTIAVLSGGGRDMFVNKWIDLITGHSGTQAESDILEEIGKEGLIPAMPRLSADGDTLYFAAVDEKSLKEGYHEGKWTGDDYNNVFPLKRQLYAMELSGSREIRQLTSDPEYRCESPVLLKNEEYLVFGRGNAKDYDGKMEIWMVDLSSGEEVKLVEWMEPEGTDTWMTDRYDDYYGRGDWSGIFAIYDTAK